VVGTGVLPVQPERAFATGRFNRVPVAWGGNHDESRLFVASAFDLQGHPVTAEQYPAFIAAAYGAAAAPRVLAEDPLASFPTPALALATVQTDFGTALSLCSDLSTERQLSRRVP